MTEIHSSRPQASAEGAAPWPSTFFRENDKVRGNRNPSAKRSRVSQPRTFSFYRKKSRLGQGAKIATRRFQKIHPGPKVEIFRYRSVTRNLEGLRTIPLARSIAIFPIQSQNLAILPGVRSNYRRFVIFDIGFLKKSTKSQKSDKKSRRSRF